MGLDGPGWVWTGLGIFWWTSAGLVGLVGSQRVLSGLGWSVNTFYDAKFVLCDLLFMINEIQYIKH